MSDIGIRTDADSLVLWRGRDFSWNFENLSPEDQPVDYPDGRLFFELQTGGEHNAIQEVEVIGGTGGYYKLIHNGNSSANISLATVTVAPGGMAPSIQTILEAVPSIGAGNVVVYPASLIPVWEIRLEQNAGSNEVQHLTFTGAINGGTFKLAYGSQVTERISYNGLTAAILKAALVALPAIGESDVIVQPLDGGGYSVEFTGALANTDVPQLVGITAGVDFLTPLDWFFGLTTSNIAALPGIRTETVRSGAPKFSEKVVNTLNNAVNGFFDGFEGLLGVDIDFKISDTRNILLTATSRRSYVESELLTFVVDATADALEGLFGTIAELNGMFETFNIDFYWKHVYQVEFLGKLANTPQPALGIDISGLVGTTTKKVKVTSLEPGKDPLTIWDFDITGSMASLKVESEEADLVSKGTKWQLVFLADGEIAGGEPIDHGTVSRVG